METGTVESSRLDPQVLDRERILGMVQVFGIRLLKPQSHPD